MGTRGDGHGQESEAREAGGRDAQGADPWEGVSPRELTAAYKQFTLKAQAEKNTSGGDRADVRYKLPEAKKRLPEKGAPLLLEPFYFAWRR